MVQDVKLPRDAIVKNVLLSTGVASSIVHSTTWSIACGPELTFGRENCASAQVMAREGDIEDGSLEKCDGVEDAEEEEDADDEEEHFQDRDLVNDEDNWCRLLAMPVEVDKDRMVFES